RAARELFQRKLECELRRAEEAGVRVLVVRPDRDEALVHGLNLLRSGDPRAAATLANERAARLLAEPEGQEFAAAWRAATTPSRPKRPPRRSAARRARRAAGGARPSGAGGEVPPHRAVHGDRGAQVRRG